MASFAMPQGVTVEQMMQAMNPRPEPEVKPEPKAEIKPVAPRRRKTEP